MIPKINRSRLFHGAIVIHDGKYTWLWDGIHGLFTLFKNENKVYKTKEELLKNL